MSAKKVLVILDTVYGDHDSLYGVSIDANLLTDEHIGTLNGSCPSNRANIPGCDPDGDFSCDDDEQKRENANLGLVWHSIDSDDLPAYTREHHCIVVTAYFDE